MTVYRFRKRHAAWRRVSSGALAFRLGRFENGYV